MSDDLLKHLLSEVREVRADIGEIKTVQAQQAGSLDEHIRRSESLETMLGDQDQRIRPLESHVAGWAGVGKALAVLAALAVVGGAIFKAVG